MKMRIIVVALMLFSLQAGMLYAEGPGVSYEASLTKIAGEVLGKDRKVLRVDAPEESGVKGLRQVRVWIDTQHGERPYLFYMSEDGQFFLSGKLFDAEGRNLSEGRVGKARPRVIGEAEMKLNDNYRIGPKDAAVRIVLWAGMDPYSKLLFESFYQIYEKNRDKVSLSLKFYPRTEGDFDKMMVLTCTSGEKAIELYKLLLDMNPIWGKPAEIEVFKETHGLKGMECSKALIKQDLGLSIDLKLPQEPRAFINGTMFIEDFTPENVNRVSGVDLKQ